MWNKFIYITWGKACNRESDIAPVPQPTSKKFLQLDTSSTIRSINSSVSERGIKTGGHMDRRKSRKSHSLIIYWIGILYKEKIIIFKLNIKIYINYLLKTTTKCKLVGLLDISLKIKTLPRTVELRYTSAQSPHTFHIHNSLNY